MSLLPSLWERIAQVAEAEDTSLSAVIEDVVARHLPRVDDLRKSHIDTQESKVGVFDE